MSVVGFNFTKINVERKAPVHGTIDITNNVVITHIEKADLALGEAKQDGIKFMYSFSSKYGPDIGEISFIGEVLYIDDKDKVVFILGEWEKNKKVPQDVMTSVLNVVLEKCNIQALILSRDVNLPAPIQLPKIGPQTQRVPSEQKSSENIKADKIDEKKKEDIKKPARK